MLTLLLVGCSLWLAYGVHLKDPIIALANGFILSFVVTILFYVLCLKETTKNVIWTHAVNPVLCIKITQACIRFYKM